MASLVVEVRKAVIAGIAGEMSTQGIAPGISCTYGWQGGSDDNRREQIYTNRPRATHDNASLKSGKNFRNERMVFDLVLMCQDPTKAPEDLDTRVLELGQVIEDFIANNKNGSAFGIAGLNWITISAFEMENRVGPTGSLTFAQWAVTYDARLT